MSKKKSKGRSQIEYTAKKRGQVELRHIRPHKLDGSHESLDPIRDNHSFSPADFSHHTFNLDAREDSSVFVPDLVSVNGIDSLKDNRLKKELMSRGDADLNKGVIEFINCVAKGEDVPKEVEQALFDKDRSSGIMVAATLEGIHRWHDFRPRNGTLGKERR